MKILKITIRSIIFLLAIVILAIVLINCSGLGQSGPGGRLLRDIVSVEVELGWPIRLHEPVPVTITLETEEDIPDMQVFLRRPDPTIRVLDGPGLWTIDSVAHHPTIFTTTIEFTNEGYFDIVAYAKDTRVEAVVRDVVHLRVTKAGATMNPPSEGHEDMAVLEETVVSPNTQVIPPTPYPIPNPVATVSVGELNRPIPDDGTWASLPLNITDIPTEARISRVNIKFIMLHPHGEELIVDLVGPDGLTAARLWARETVGPEDLYEGKLLYYSPPLTTTFSRLPVAGEWQLRVRDEVPGHTGAIDAVTLVVEYEMPATPTPAPLLPQEKPTPWEPPPPSEEPPEPTPESKEGHSGPSPPKNGGLPSLLAQDEIAAQGTWTTLATQGFEGLFPGYGWTAVDLSNDGYERYWDDDNYRPHSGSWAAWPANGGADYLDPIPGNDNYPNNMNTRMIYGPFDLSDAVQARLSFYLWRQIEGGEYDYLLLETSRDGIAFTEKFRWNTTSTSWEKWTVYLNEYVGDNSVWLAWRFRSDYSLTYDGPWVDDIVIEKQLPGQVTARGYFYFYDRNNVVRPAAHTSVYLYDSDPLGSDDYLGATLTDANGYWQIGPVTNRDDPGDLTLDLYAKFKTSTTKRTVTNHSGSIYAWSSSTYIDVGDGTVDFGDWYVANNSKNEGAMWIFQDAYQAWTFPAPHDPGPVTIRWARDDEDFATCRDGTSCFWPYWPIEGVFIAGTDREEPDVVVHEIGHAYMYNEMGSVWLWDPSLWDDYYDCLQHGFFDEESELCAWAEGWANFYALAVNNDPCFDFGPGACTPGSTNLETQWPGDGRFEGDRVEARVAGALWDIYDTAPDGFDQFSYGFEEIWDTFTHWQTVGNGQRYDSFRDFWAGWFDRGHYRHHANNAIYQNTIDYNIQPYFILVPDYSLPLNTTRENAFRLEGLCLGSRE